MRAATGNRGNSGNNENRGNRGNNENRGNQGNNFPWRNHSRQKGGPPKVSANPFGCRSRAGCDWNRTDGSTPLASTLIINSYDNQRQT